MGGAAGAVRWLLRVCPTAVLGLAVSAAPAVLVRGEPASGAPATEAVDAALAKLSFVYRVDQEWATPGRAVTYTVLFSNTGQVDYVDISVADDVTDVIDDADLGSVLTHNAERVEEGGRTKVVWTGDLPIGATVAVRYTATVKRPDPGNHIMLNHVSSAADGSICSEANACGVRLPVAELSVDMAVDRAGAAPGDLVTYTVRIANAGQVALTAAEVTADLTGVLDDAAFGTVAVSDGAATQTGRMLTWAGDLVVGPAGTATVIYSVTVKVTPHLGDYRLRSAISASTPSSNCPDGTGCTADTPTSGVVLAMTAGTGPVRPGAKVTYTVTATNVGQRTVPTTFTNDLARVLDDARYNGDAQASAGSVAYRRPTLAWAGNPPPGQSATMTYSVTVHAAGAGDGRLINAVRSTSETNCTTDATVGIGRCLLALTVQEPAALPVRAATAGPAGNQATLPATGAPLADLVRTGVGLLGLGVLLLHVRRSRIPAAEK